jgi:hypothetical protein
MPTNEPVLSKEVSITKPSEWVRWPATHPGASGVSAATAASEARSHRIKTRSRWDLRIITSATSGTLTGEHGIVESGMHAATTHSAAVARSNSAAEGIVGSEALRVEISVADPRVAGSGQATAGWTLGFEFVFEARHGFGHRAARVCEWVGERVGSSWVGVAVVAEGVSLRSVGVGVVVVVVVVCGAGI